MIVKNNKTILYCLYMLQTYFQKWIRRRYINFRRNFTSEGGKEDSGMCRETSLPVIFYFIKQPESNMVVCYNCLLYYYFTFLYFKFFHK